MSRPSTRERLLEAAAALANEQGAGHISLDAVAERAGVSKGGLLYHFPSKAALMRACVEFFVQDFEAQIEARIANGKVSLLAAVTALAMEQFSKKAKVSGGVLAAMAEDPDFLLPIREFNRRLLDRLLAETDDPQRTLLVFLALEGLRSSHLYDMNMMTPEELDLACRAISTA